jgi:mRNA interferase HigB
VAHGCVPMHVITRKRLNEFVARHPDAAPALDHWYRLMKSGAYRSFVDLRSALPSADQVDRLTVFNVGGNRVRLIAAVSVQASPADRMAAEGGSGWAAGRVDRPPVPDEIRATLPPVVARSIAARDAAVPQGSVRVAEWEAPQRPPAPPASRPPAPDPPGSPPPPPRQPGPRRAGGQPGPRGHGRALRPGEPGERVRTAVPRPGAQGGTPRSAAAGPVAPPDVRHPVHARPPVPVPVPASRAAGRPGPAGGALTRTARPAAAPAGTGGPRLLAAGARVRGR